MAKARKKRTVKKAAPKTITRRVYVAAKKTPRRRRKVSGVNASKIKSSLMDVAETAGGILVGRFLGKNLQKFVGQSTAPFVLIGGGVLVSMMVKKPIAKAMGIGIAAQGVSSLIPDASIPSIAGVPMLASNAPFLANNMSNYSNIRVLPNSARNRNRMINGTKNRNMTVSIPIQAPHRSF